MDGITVLGLIVWGVAESIGYFNKKEFKQRVKTAAIWCAAILSLYILGMLDSSKSGIIYNAMAILLASVFVVPIYFFRLYSFNFIRRRFNISDEKVTGEIQYNQENSYKLTIWIAQFFAIIAGYFVGIFILSILLAITMIGQAIK